MAGIVDVASYILKHYGTMTTMKLQKLVYYSQAKYLVDHPGKLLFNEDFQAWKNGPVSAPLFRLHRKKFLIRPGELGVPESEDCLTVEEQRTIQQVCDVLNNFTGNDLSRRTHSEDPWLDARGDSSPTENSSTIITKDAMREFYSSPEHQVI